MQLLGRDVEQHPSLWVALDLATAHAVAVATVQWYIRTLDLKRRQILSEDVFMASANEQVGDTGSTGRPREDKAI